MFKKSFQGSVPPTTYQLINFLDSTNISLPHLVNLHLVNIPLASVEIKDFLICHPQIEEFTTYYNMVRRDGGFLRQASSQQNELTFDHLPNIRRMRMFNKIVVVNQKKNQE